MNNEYLLDALTDIDDAYIIAAEKRLGDPTGAMQKTVGFQKTRRGLKRSLTVAAAIVLLLAVSFTTAMAVSEEFRERAVAVGEEIKEKIASVFGFRSVEQADVMPEYDADKEITVDNMSIEDEKTDIGGVIEGTYVHAPMACHARNGIFAVCTDEVEMKQGSRYDAYIEENGEFIKLEERTFCQEYTVLGNEIHVEFDWVEHNGYVSQTWVDPDVMFRVPNRTGDINAVLMNFWCTITDENGEKAHTEYPVLIDMETGELNDILAGTGAEKLANIDQSAISDDLRKMLLSQSDGAFWYADLTSKTLYNVEELSGEKADACSLIGDTLACWVLEHGSYRAWSIDLNTFERKELFSGMFDAASTEKFDPGIVFLSGFDGMNHWGNMFAGTRFALEADIDRNVYVIDLASGERTLIEGFTWPDRELRRIASPDGKKALIASDLEKTFDYVGIIDFEKKEYIAFSRVNNNVNIEISEGGGYWFDNDSIVISADGSPYESKDFYIYRLKEDQ